MVDGKCHSAVLLFMTMWDNESVFGLVAGRLQPGGLVRVRRPLSGQLQPDRDWDGVLIYGRLREGSEYGSVGMSVELHHCVR